MQKQQYNSLTLKLKMLRLEAGKSQEEFAKELGVSRSTLANYETGKRLPDNNFICKIAKYCNVLTDFFETVPPYQKTALNEETISDTQKLKSLIQNRGKTLNLSNLPLENKISLFEYYDFILANQHKQKEEELRNQFR